jgi:hypothetical protein
MIPFKGTYRTAAIIAIVHVAGAALTAWWVSVAAQTSGQAPMIWIVWMLIDFPVSFLSYELLDASPIIVHVIIGSLWWFFLGMVFARIFQTPRTSSAPSNNALERTRNG